MVRIVAFSTLSLHPLVFPQTTYSRRREGGREGYLSISGNEHKNQQRRKLSVNTDKSLIRTDLSKVSNLM